MNGSSGVFVCHDSNNTLDKTWNEIKEASATLPVILITNPNNNYSQYGYIRQVRTNNEDMYAVVFDVAVDGPHGDLGLSFKAYIASTADGYPVHE